MRTRRMYILLGISVGLLLAILGSAYLFSTDKPDGEKLGTVKVESLNNVRQVKVYEAVESEEGYVVPQDQDPKVVINGPGSYQLPQKHYIYVAEPVDGRAQQKISDFSLHDTYTLGVIAAYPDQHLGALLNTELGTITSVFTSSYPQQMRSYQLVEPKLHLDGRWFTAKLHPITDTEILPKLRVILSKNGDSWVIYKTPLVIFPYEENQEVPREVLVELNNR